MSQGMIVAGVIAGLVAVGGVAGTVGYNLGYNKHRDHADERLLPGAATLSFINAVCGPSVECDFRVVVREQNTQDVEYRVASGTVVRGEFLPGACTGTQISAYDTAENCRIVRSE